ncbi:MAG: hypothetical protein IJ274_10815 [Lachnospiraceae bacterium]|nr:hypothetical protein [Lachnospiraceae bacterium]
MIAKIKYNYSTHGKDSDIELGVDLSRFEKQYGKAQYALDSMIMTSMQPYMPHRTGTFINVTKAMSAAIAGSGNVYAAAPPFGRFLYEGKVMVDPKTNNPWARPGAKKVVTDRDIEYDKNHNPKVTDHWFDIAKKNYGDSWIKAVKGIAGGG